MQPTFCTVQKNMQHTEFILYKIYSRLHLSTRGFGPDQFSVSFLVSTQENFQSDRAPYSNLEK